MEGKGKIKRAFYLMFMAAFVVTFFVCITGCSETEDVAGIVDASDGADVEYSAHQETQETIDDGVAESAESNVVEDNAADNIAAEEYGTGEEEAKYTFTSMSEVMYVTHNLNIRDLPDMTGNIIGELKKGEPVYVIGKCNETGWFSLQSGYVCNDFISMDRPEETTDESDEYVSDSQQEEIQTSEVGEGSNGTYGVENSETDNHKASSSGSGGDSNFNTYDNPEQQQTSASYVLNTSSKKFHLPNCDSVVKISPQNYATGNDRDALIAQGYKPCKKCNP